MRAISNRIRRLESILAPQALDQQDGVAAVLVARRRRRLKAAGLPFKDEPRIRWTAAQCRNVSLVDIFSGRYNDKNPPP